MDLQDVLAAIISGGAGGLVYLLMEHVRWLRELAPEAKRYASLALGCVLPVIAWLIMVAMGYAPAPETWQGWVEAIFSMATVSLVVSQGLHGALKLGDR